MKLLTEKTLSEIQREWFERYQIARAKNRAERGKNQ